MEDSANIYVCDIKAHAKFLLFCISFHLRKDFLSIPFFKGIIHYFSLHLYLYIVPPSCDSPSSLNYFYVIELSWCQAPCKEENIFNMLLLS